MSRLERLMSYLDQDPDNPRLMADAAEAAFEEGQLSEAVALVERQAALAPLTPSLTALLGRVAIAEGRDEDARAVFESLLAAHPGDPALRYNLGLVLERRGELETALERLGPDNETWEIAALKVRLLHRLERLEAAIAIGDGWDEGRDSDPRLWGGLSAVAIDTEDMVRARTWAERGASSTDGQVTLGMLTLAEGEAERALGFFEQAVRQRPGTARGALGLGMVALGEDQPAVAAEHFQRAAHAFATHLGSWVAAGWAWLLADAPERGEACFHKAVALDDSYGEAQAGLAYVDWLRGQTHEADRRARIALRLDPSSLGGALVQSQIAAATGRDGLADKIRQGALMSPVGPRGETVAALIEAQVLARNARTRAEPV